MRANYPRWDLTVTLEQTIAQIVDAWQHKLVSRGFSSPLRAGSEGSTLIRR